MLVKGQVFPWKAGSLQTSNAKRSGLLDTLLVCLCAGQWVCLGVFLHECDCVSACLCAHVSTWMPWTSPWTWSCVYKCKCVLTTALPRTAGLVSSGTGSACCDWMTSSQGCVKGLSSSDDYWVGYQHSRPLGTTVHFISPTVPCSSGQTLSLANPLHLFNRITQLHAKEFFIHSLTIYTRWSNKKILFSMAILCTEELGYYIARNNTKITVKLTFKHLNI